MKTMTTIWADEENKIKVEVDAYSDGKYYVRIDIKPDGLSNASLYLNVKQARDLQLQLLKIALDSKYDYKKEKMPNFFSEEYHKKETK